MSATSCGSGASCNIVDDTLGKAPITDCVRAGTGVGPYGCVGSLCVPGTQCTAFELGFSACETYCRVGQQDCANGFTCEAMVPAEMIGGDTIGLCQDTCSLTDPSAVCGSEGACVAIVDGTNPPHTACVGYEYECPLPATLPLGAACTSDTSCPPGATCQSGSCVAWCTVGPTAHCPGGTTCVATVPSLVIGGVQYGTCQ
jgi:hypothetical protein